MSVVSINAQACGHKPVDMFNGSVRFDACNNWKSMQICKICYLSGLFHQHNWLAWVLHCLQFSQKSRCRRSSSRRWCCGECRDAHPRLLLSINITSLSLSLFMFVQRHICLWQTSRSPSCLWLVLYTLSTSHLSLSLYVCPTTHLSLADVLVVHLVLDLCCTLVAFLWFSIVSDVYSPFAGHPGHRIYPWSCVCVVGLRQSQLDCLNQS